MTAQVLKHKGQIGSIEFDIEDNCMFGKLLHINDLITYEASTLQELKKEFEAAVEDYLETCKSMGLKPNKPFTGSFNIRPGAELHKKIAFKAASEGISINDAVTKAILNYVNQDRQKELLHNRGDQIRSFVYRTSTYASRSHEVKAPAPAEPIWSGPIEGEKGIYSITVRRNHEH